MLKASVQKEVNLSFIVRVVQLESLKLDKTFLLHIPTVWKFLHTKTHLWRMCIKDNVEAKHLDISLFSSKKTT